MHPPHCRVLYHPCEQIFDSDIGFVFLLNHSKAMRFSCVQNFSLLCFSLFVSRLQHILVIILTWPKHSNAHYFLTPHMCLFWLFWAQFIWLFDTLTEAIKELFMLLNSVKCFLSFRFWSDYMIFFYFHDGHHVASGNHSAINSCHILVRRLATPQVLPRPVIVHVLECH